MYFKLFWSYIFVASILGAKFKACATTDTVGSSPSLGSAATNPASTEETIKANVGGPSSNQDTMTRPKDTTSDLLSSSRELSATDSVTITDTSKINATPEELDRLINKIFEQDESSIEPFYALLNKNTINIAITSLTQLADIYLADIYITRGIFSNEHHGHQEALILRATQNLNVKIKQIMELLVRETDNDIKERLEQSVKDIFSDETDLSVPPERVSKHLQSFLESFMISRLKNMKLHFLTMFELAELQRKIDKHVLPMTKSFQGKYNVIKQAFLHQEIFTMSRIDDCSNGPKLDKWCDAIFVYAFGEFHRFQNLMSDEQKETHNKAISMVFNSIAHLQKHDKHHLNIDWFARLFITACVLYDSPRMDDINRSLLKKSEVGLDTLRKALKIHRINLNDKQKIEVNVCEMHAMTRDETLISQHKSEIERIYKEITAPGVYLDDVFQQILVARYEILHKHGIILETDSHFVRFRDTCAIMKDIYLRLFDNPNDLIRKYAENFYQSVDPHDASAINALKHLFLLTANLDYPIMGIVKDELFINNPKIHQETAIEIVAIFETISHHSALLNDVLKEMLESNKLKKQLEYFRQLLKTNGEEQKINLLFGISKNLVDFLRSKPSDDNSHSIKLLEPLALSVKTAFTNIVYPSIPMQVGLARVHKLLTANGILNGHDQSDSHLQDFIKILMQCDETKEMNEEIRAQYEREQNYDLLAITGILKVFSYPSKGNKPRETKSDFSKRLSKNVKKLYLTMLHLDLIPKFDFNIINPPTVRSLLDAHMSITQFLSTMENSMELNCLISSRGIERTISDLNDKLQLHLSETASVIISPISDMQSQILDAWKREYWETRRVRQRIGEQLLIVQSTLAMDHHPKSEMVGHQVDELYQTILSAMESNQHSSAILECSLSDIDYLLEDIPVTVAKKDDLKPYIEMAKLHCQTVRSIYDARAKREEWESILGTYLATLPDYPTKDHGAIFYLYVVEFTDSERIKLKSSTMIKIRLLDDWFARKAIGTDYYISIRNSAIAIINSWGNRIPRVEIMDHLRKMSHIDSLYTEIQSGAISDPRQSNLCERWLMVLNELKLLLVLAKENITSYFGMNKTMQSKLVWIDLKLIDACIDVTELQAHEFRPLLTIGLSSLDVIKNDREYFSMETAKIANELNEMSVIIHNKMSEISKKLRAGEIKYATYLRYNLQSKESTPTAGETVKSLHHALSVIISFQQNTIE